MPAKVTSTAIIRLLDSLQRPVYVVDAQRRLVFCNRECERWIGIDRRLLLGRKCCYRVPETPVGLRREIGGDDRPTTTDNLSQKSLGEASTDGKQERPNDIAADQASTSDRQASEVSQQAHLSEKYAEQLAEAAACGLCPPPEVFSSAETRRAMVCVWQSSGRLSRKEATFLPIQDVDGTVALVVGLVTQELKSEGQPEPTTLQAEHLSSTKASELHARLVELHNKERQLLRCKQLIGTTPAMELVRRQVQLAADSTSPVLLVGPPGSGRQRLAYYIHEMCPQTCNGTLVPLDCSVLGADLLRSTVAALTSAELQCQKLRPTTLLLNHVDKTPPEVQHDLAEMLAAPGFPLRVIGTADRPLEEMVGAQQMDRRLVCTLSTLVIKLPALQDRVEDIPLLAQAMLEEINGREEKQVQGFTPEAIDDLCSYHWPGNLDELFQYIAQAHEQAKGLWITPQDLPPRIHHAQHAAVANFEQIKAIKIDEFLAQIERELITRALEYASGNKAKAARMLGLTRPRLYRRMVQLGLATDNNHGDNANNVTGNGQPQ